MIMRSHTFIEVYKQIFTVAIFFTFSTFFSYRLHLFWLGLSGVMNLLICFFLGLD